MKFKITFLAMCIVICLFAMAGVCAGDTNDDVLAADNITQTDSFTMNNETLTENDEAFQESHDVSNLNDALTIEDKDYIHIYVNASASLPGNGTKEAPYQNLS